MITDIRYKFDGFNIIEKDNDLFLEPTIKNCNYDQQMLFTVMLNLGYIGFEPGVFCITAKDIVNFWNYANATVLNDYSIESYYSILKIDAPYKERIPLLKTEGSFHAKDFCLSVTWIKTDSNMYSAPIAYEQKGLKLKELDFGDVIGSLYPEYLELYYKIDKANSNWTKWSNKEKYDFLEELDEHTKKREFIIPMNLKELINKHRNEEA